MKGLEEAGKEEGKEGGSLKIFPIEEVRLLQIPVKLQSSRAELVCQGVTRAEAEGSA